MEPSPIKSDDSIGLELEGRRYFETPRNRLTSEAETPAFPLMEEIETVLWQSLPLVRQEASAPPADLLELVQRYGESIVKLMSAREETIRFFQAMVRANLEFRAESLPDEKASHKALEEEFSRTMEQVVFPPFSMDETYSARLANMPLEHAEARLRAALEKTTRAFVRDFFACCDRLVHEQVVGLVRWLNPSTCILFFFRKVVIQRGFQRIQSTETRRDELGDDHNTYWDITRTREHVEGEFEFRLARHEHHLLEANSVPLDAAATPIPQIYVPVAAAIPSWFRPFTRLITGMQIFGQVTEKELRKERVSEDRVLPEVRVLFEPAIALGHYIFSGWGEEEMTTENLRTDLIVKEDEQQRAVCLAEAMKRRRAWYFLGIQGIALVMAVAGDLYAPGTMNVGLLLALVGVLPGVDWLRWDRKGRGETGDYLSLVVGGCGLVFLVVSVHAAVAAAAFLSLKLAALALLTFVLASLFGSAVLPEKPKEQS